MAADKGGGADRAAGGAAGGAGGEAPRARALCALRLRRAKRALRLRLARAPPVAGRCRRRGRAAPRRAQVPWPLAARAFVRSPPLLTCRPELLAARAARLAALPGAGPARVRGALCCMPSLLSHAAETVEGRWAALAAAAATHPPWAAYLAAAPPASLASLLVRPAGALARLQYLADTRQQAAGGSLKYVLDAPLARLEAKAPGFASWREARGRAAAGPAPQQARGPPAAPGEQAHAPPAA